LYWWIIPHGLNHCHPITSFNTCDKTQQPSEEQEPQLNSYFLEAARQTFDNARFRRYKTSDRITTLFLLPTSPLRSSKTVNRFRRISSINHLSVLSMPFHVLLTFLSKFFSTFLRSTSPLSVSMSYLDLGEIYLLLYAEFPIYATLRIKEIR